MGIKFKYNEHHKETKYDNSISCHCVLYGDFCITGLY